MNIIDEVNKDIETTVAVDIEKLSADDEKPNGYIRRIKDWFLDSIEAHFIRLDKLRVYDNSRP